MQKYGIPTAQYKIYEDATKAKEQIDSFGFPVVIKADGLAAGKGVIIADTKEEAIKTIDMVMRIDILAKQETKVVIEEFYRVRKHPY